MGVRVDVGFRLAGKRSRDVGYRLAGERYGVLQIATATDLGFEAAPPDPGGIGWTQAPLLTEGGAATWSAVLRSTGATMLVVHCSAAASGELHDNEYTSDGLSWTPLAGCVGISVLGPDTSIAGLEALLATSTLLVVETPDTAHAADNFGEPGVQAGTFFTGRFS